MDLAQLVEQAGSPTFRDTQHFCLTLQAVFDLSELEQSPLIDWLLKIPTRHGSKSGALLLI